MAKGAFSDLAAAGAEFRVRVTPRARGNTVSRVEGGLAVCVTAPLEDGKANAPKAPDLTVNS